MLVDVAVMADGDEGIGDNDMFWHYSQQLGPGRTSLIRSQSPVSRPATPPSQTCHRRNPSILIQQITTRGISGQYLLTCPACGWTSVQITPLVELAAVAHSNECKQAPGREPPGTTPFPASGSAASDMHGSGGLGSGYQAATPEPMCTHRQGVG
jgi:hypothetical protein